MKARLTLASLVVLALLQFVAAGPGLAQGPGTPPDKGAAPQAVFPPNGQLVDVWWFEQTKPAVAMGDGQALVVWEDTRPGDGAYQAIYARYTNVAGVALGIPFPLSSLATVADPRKSPDVAYNSKSGKYLAVWEWASAVNPDIYGNLIGKTGSAVGEWPAAMSSLDEHNPAVAANTTGGEFLVAYEVHVGDPEFGRHDIYAVRVDAWTGFVIGTGFAVDATALNKRNPAVAYDPYYNQYLVVWEEYVPGSCEGRICYNIMGRRVAADGTLQGERITIGLFGGGRDNPASPDVAFNNTANEFMVVWSDHNFNTADNWDVLGRFVRGDGAVLSLLVLSGAGEGNTRNRLNPSVAYDSFADEYLVVFERAWDAADHDVLYTRVGGNGLVLVSDLWLSSESWWESRPDLAATGYGGYLTVWQDNRWNATLLTGMDIYDAVVRVRYAAFLPLVRKGG